MYPICKGPTKTANKAIPIDITQYVSVSLEIKYGIKNISVKGVTIASAPINNALKFPLSLIAPYLINSSPFLDSFLSINSPKNSFLLDY